MQVMCFMDVSRPSCTLTLTLHLACLGPPPNRLAGTAANQESIHDRTTLRPQKRRSCREAAAGSGIGGGAGGDLSGLGSGQYNPAAALESGPSRQAQGLTRPPAAAR